MKDFLCAEKYWEYIKNQELTDTRASLERLKIKQTETKQQQMSNINYSNRNYYKLNISGIKGTNNTLSERIEMNHRILPENLKPYDNIDYVEDLNNVEWNDALK